MPRKRLYVRDVAKRVDALEAENRRFPRGSLMLAIGIIILSIAVVLSARSTHRTLSTHLTLIQIQDEQIELMRRRVDRETASLHDRLHEIEQRLDALADTEALIDNRTDRFTASASAVLLELGEHKSDLHR